MLDYSKNEFYKLSYDNLFYDTSLNTPEIESAAEELFEAFRLVVLQKITKDVYNSVLNNYFETIYDATLAKWTANRIICRQLFDLENPRHTHLPVECVRLSSRELEFINERWRCWAARDGELLVDDEFDNNIGEIDYSYIEPPPKPIVKSPEYRMNFGKYHPDKAKRYVTIRELWETDPQYLLWAHKNVDRFQMSEELLMETQEWARRWQHTQN